VEKNLFNENRFLDYKKNIIIRIGNDVWIGNNVTILGGVSVGNGAIIGAGAVVTKNVEPYSIVGGVPAKVLKYRFDETSRKSLLNFAWWEKDIQWIKKHAVEFSNVSDFLKYNCTNETDGI
jgi:serine acetyltransferase